MRWKINLFPREQRRRTEAVIVSVTAADGASGRKRETDMKHTARERNAATCALDDSELDQVSGGICDPKAEAAAKTDTATSAATTQLILGIVAGACAVASACAAFTPSGKRR
jgi:hypothetical protein